MLCVLIAIGILGSVGNSKPLLAGQPGGPWNTEEIDIVRQKVLQIMPAIISRGLYILNPLIEVQKRLFKFFCSLKFWTYVWLVLESGF